jgi:hypothetical protein
MKNTKIFFITICTVFNAFLAQNTVANTQHNDVQLDKCVLNPSTADCEKKYREKLKEAKDNKEPAKATRA